MRRRLRHRLNLIIANSTHLTLNPGTIVKAANNAGLTVNGSLIASGTAGSPVVFTSLRDDTVGGDTNGDGSASSPAAGDWAGLNVLSGASMNLDHVKISYAGQAFYVVQATSAAVAITNSVITKSAGVGVHVISPSAVPTITGNTVNEVSGQAILVEGASVDLAKLNSNSGSGNGGNGVFLYEDTQTVDTTLPWSGCRLPVLRGCSYFYVAAGVTLTLNPGTVIKAYNCAALVVNGSLVAAGTAASPVTFTSYYDDTVGGDTNGDGSASSPAAGDWAGLNVLSGASMNLDHVKISYAGQAFYVVQATSAAVAITNSVITKSAGVGVHVISPSAVPTITGNTVTEVSGQAILVEGASVDLAKLNSNSGSGNGGNGVFLYEDTQTVDTTLPWSGTLLPVLRGCSYFYVAAGVTLTLNPGTVIKAYNCAALVVNGSLVAAGTAASPVTFTSYYDDTVGGDTNGDGSASSPAAGDWAGLNVGADGVASLDGVDVRYASTASTAASGSFVEIPRLGGQVCLRGEWFGLVPRCDGR